MTREALQLLLILGLPLIALAAGFRLGRWRPQRPTVEPALAEELRRLRPRDLELLVQPILLVANPGQFALEVMPRASTASSSTPWPAD